VQRQTRTLQDHVQTSGQLGEVATARGNPEPADTAAVGVRELDRRRLRRGRGVGGVPVPRVCVALVLSVPALWVSGLIDGAYNSRLDPCTPSQA
jgi:hypothetical protein